MSDYRDMPDGTRNGGMWIHCREQATNALDRATREKRATFSHVLEKKFYEVLCEEDKTKLHEKLIELSTVAGFWIQKLEQEAAK